MSSPSSDERNGFDLTATPMTIGRVSLRVRDLDCVSGFYRDALGLRVRSTINDTVSLGTADRTLLELIGDKSAAPRDPRGAGLFHTAFLLPRRADFARWLAHAIEKKIRISGASDHRVSEAIYLSDPEGNGIEVYADRPPTLWTSKNGQLDMPSDPLDIDDLLRAGAGGEWVGIPVGSVVGHVHLQVGDTAAAERFYADVLGFSVTCRYPGGSFFGSGGYHHQLAANVWNSRRAGARPNGAAGLDRFEIVLKDLETLNSIEHRARSANLKIVPVDNGIVLRDPWNIEIMLVVA